MLSTRENVSEDRGKINTLRALAPYAVRVKARSKEPANKGWPNVTLSPDDVAAWIEDGGNLGVKAATLPAIDVDIKQPALRGLADLAEKLARECVGNAPVRGRSDSPSRLLLYRAPDGEALRSPVIRFRTAAGLEAQIELRASQRGQQHVVYGTHPDGAAYTWDRDFTPDDLPVLTADAWERFAHEFCARLRRIGHTVLKDGTGAAAASAPGGAPPGGSTPVGRKPLGCAEHLAPDPGCVMTALAGYANTDAHFPRRDGHGTDCLLPFLSAVKSALGPHADDRADDVEAWACEYDGPTPFDEEAFRKIWDSIRDSAHGWDYVADVSGYRRRAEFLNEMFPDDTEALDREIDAHKAAQKARDREAAKRKRPAILFLDELAASPEVRDFVEDTLCEGQLSVVFGKSNTCKSFLGLDLGMHVGLGWPWCGREVERGGVVYIAGEGAAGLQQRVRAFRQHHGEDKTADAWFAIAPAAVNFRDPQAVAGLVETIRDAAKHLGGCVRLVIVDTLSRAMAGGNENSPDDMGALVNGADYVKHETGAHVMFVHHSGKDAERGARGHSLLRAAVDSEFEVARPDENGAVTLTATKQRDLEYGKPLAFQLRTVSMGTNRRGKPITSCVVEPADAGALRPKAKQLSKNAQTALRVLRDMLPEGGEDAPVRTDAWREAAYAEFERRDGLQKGSLRRTFNRARDELEAAGLIETRGENVAVSWTEWTDKGGRN